MGIYKNICLDMENNNSNLSTEIVAGISTYLSLAYIFIVNPAILSQAGIPSGAVFFATIIASVLATLAMGIFSRLPFALAPGLETNSFVAFVVVGSLGFSWQEALGLVFWSGVICLAFTIFPIRQRIIDSIPVGLKSSIAIMVGVFVAVIGLVITDTLSFDQGMITGIGNLESGKPILLLVGLLITIVLGLKRLNFPGGMLVAIIICALIAKYLGITADTPPAKTEEFFAAVGKMELFSVLLDPRAWSVLLVLFMIDFFGSVSKFIALTSGTTLQDQDGTVKNMKEALYVDGGATMLGATMGTTTMITYVESSVGITSGGRTGMVAIVCAVLMALSLFFTPLVGLIPVAATGGILLYVGYLLAVPTLDRFRKGKIGKSDILIGCLMGIITLLTFSLDKSMLVGFCLYTLKDAYQVKGLPNIYLLGSSVALAVAMVAQNIF